MRRIGLLLLAAAGAACSEPPRPPDPRLWTLFDVQALYAQGKPGTFAIAMGAGLPDGIALDHILGTDRSTLAVRDATDFYPAAYVTTEVWTHYDRVWIEPMYVLRTADGNVVRSVGGDVQPIFSVGPRSGFYSPFWQTIYVDVPDGTTPQSLASVRQIIDSGYPLHPGPGRTVSLVPDGTVVDAAGTGISPMVTPDTGQGWLDGAPVSFLDFGPSTFTWDEHGVITETPLYHFFLFAGVDGALKELDVPAVAAAGPPYANAAAPIVGGLPRYPSYWRLYTVVLPPEARVFLPPKTEALLPGLKDELPPMPTDYSPEVIAAPLEIVQPYAGHVAIDPVCFTATSVDLETCKWLDTQASLERYLDPGAIAPTDITVTCPLVSVGQKPVSPGAW